MKTNEEIENELRQRIDWHDLALIISEIRGMLDYARRQRDYLNADRASLSQRTYEERYGATVLRTSMLGAIANALETAVLSAQNTGAWVSIEFTPAINAIGGAIATLRMLKNGWSENPDTARNANDLLQSVLAIARHVESALTIPFLD